MGNYVSLAESPPPMVLVPPLFDFPPLAARNRMLESSYNLLFGKLALKCLFEDYFEEAQHFTTRIMLKPIDDPHVDLIATVSGPLDHKPEENIDGNAFFRWQSSDVHDPHTFMDLYVSNCDPVASEDYGVMGLRYGSECLSIGATIMPFALKEELPKNAWLVSKIGRLSLGVQYEPHFGSIDGAKYKNLKNWSAALGYGIGSASPLSPSFNFGLELAKRSQFTASFYQHVVVQRRVKNPFEGDEVVGITNYIDFGFELQARVDDDKTSKDFPDSAFNVAASWQANKNFLLKAKIGPLTSSFVLAFKSWWKPSFTFNVTATRNRMTGKTGYGFGIRVENLREASYQRAEPNFIMLTPSKEHLAEGILKNGNRPMFQADVNAENYEGLPREMRPYGRIL
ncbi:hypothetical protein LINPERPRIM_LOCUS31739 [Linum perenne]